MNSPSVCRSTLTAIIVRKIDDAREKCPPSGKILRARVNFELLRSVKPDVSSRPKDRRLLHIHTWYCIYSVVVVVV
jgi:hypothetical protein